MTITVVLELTDLSLTTVDSSEEEEYDRYIMDYRQIDDIQSGYVRDIVENSYVARNQDDEILVAIPSRYADSLGRYCHWLNDRKLTIADDSADDSAASQLAEDLQLAIYLDDPAYSLSLVKLLSQQYLRQLDTLLLVKIDNDYLDKFLLQLPYNLLPTAYKHSVDFRSRWFSKSQRNRQVTIDGVKYYINQESQLQLNNREPKQLHNWEGNSLIMKMGLVVSFWDLPGYPISQLSYYMPSSYQNILLEGVVHKFDRLGHIEEMTQYHHGRRHGLSIHFNNFGYVEHYVNDQLINRAVNRDWSRPLDPLKVLTELDLSHIYPKWQGYVTTAKRRPADIDKELYIADVPLLQ